jgi:putative membrane protein insertion efficiency factor
MPWIRRRYDPRYDYDPYVDPGWGRRRRYNSGNSCLRDACLLESGCCVAEALDGNCLVAGLMLLPQLMAVAVAGHAAPASSRSGAALVEVIRLYQQKISARRPAVCRFSPSCSEYAAQAIDGHGAVRGVWLTGRRLVRCRPGGARGADPVPA